MGGYPNSRAEFRAEIDENVICNTENVICNTFWTSFATRIGVQLGGEGHLCEIWPIIGGNLSIIGQNIGPDGLITQNGQKCRSGPKFFNLSIIGQNPIRMSTEKRVFCVSLGVEHLFIIGKKPIRLAIEQK